MMVFDHDESSFLNELNADVPALGCQKPVEIIETDTGLQEVIEQLLRMEYSIPR